MQQANDVFYAKNCTLQVMVRDEYWTIWEALMSTLPYVEAAVVFDTGSTDGTVDLIQDVMKRYPGKVQLIQKDLPNMQPWGVTGKPFVPSIEVGSVRNVMRDASKTELLLTVDADEVYPRDAMRALVAGLNSFGKNLDCAYVPLHWFGNDIKHIASKCDPAVYPITGRVFRNRPGYEHRGVFPGECAHYDGVIPRPGEQNCILFQFEPKMCHYEMTTKPWRRTLLEQAAYNGPIPEVFDQREKLIGPGLLTALNKGMKHPFTGLR